LSKGEAKIRRVIIDSGVGDVVDLLIQFSLYSLNRWKYYNQAFLLDGVVKYRYRRSFKGIKR
jgi:hypothetical protein